MALVLIAGVFDTTTNYYATTSECSTSTVGVMNDRVRTLTEIGGPGAVVAPMVRRSALAFLQMVPGACMSK
jgi:hypothetical protein